MTKRVRIVASCLTPQENITLAKAKRQGRWCVVVLLYIPRSIVILQYYSVTAILAPAREYSIHTSVHINAYKLVTGLKPNYTTLHQPRSLVSASLNNKYQY